MRPVEEQGYIIVATEDYISNAIGLVNSLRQFHPQARVCLLTDVDYQDSLFDHVRLLDAPNKENPWANDWQVFRKTPFRETIKLEADMLIASPIDHWWSLFAHRDVVVSTGCRTWRGNVSTNKMYRNVFVENNLPDVYNAITYWRLSHTAQEFFRLVRDIFERWDEYKTLIKFPEETPSTDLVYAMAATIVGPEQVTMPFASYPQIVHMKQYHAGTQNKNWTQELVWEHNPLRINTVAQWGAFHYYIKDWQCIQKN